MISNFQDQLVGEAQHLMPYFQDENVTDILINGTSSFYIDGRSGLVEKANPFTHSDNLFYFIERLVVAVGKQIDATAPFIDGRLLDGSRFHVVLPPLAVQGPLISIRKRKSNERELLKTFGPSDLLKWIRDQLGNQKNFLISGGTGTGKTTLLSGLIAEIDVQERIILVEEVSEIQAKHPHLIHLEARSANSDGRGKVGLQDLVRTALRMRPNRLVVGECRGAEAFDMLQAMNTGHGGSLGTLHANSARDALRRFEALTLLAGLEIPLPVVRDWISSLVFGVIHLERMGQKRYISEVLTVSGVEGSVYRFFPRYQAQSNPTDNEVQEFAT